MMKQPKKPADDKVRVRVINDHDTCFLVEAAAGTGKTTILVDRVLSIVRAQRAELPQIVAITFTEKAAGELKVKLRERLEEALRDRAEADQVPLLKKAISDLERMTVSTIHSFCAELIRERPIEADVEPGFVVADELTASLLREETWDEWLAEEMNRAGDESAALRRAIEYGVTLAHLAELATFLVNHRDTLPSLATPADPADKIHRFLERVQEQVAGFSRLMDEHCQDRADKAASHLEELSQIVNSLDQDDADACGAVVRNQLAIKPTSGNQRNWKPASVLKDIKQGLRYLQEAHADVCAALDEWVLGGLLCWLLPFVERYQHVKRERNLLDFADMLILARDMLARSPAGRQYFKRKYKFMLVDEFQDTDPLQTEIVFFLCERRGKNVDEWDKVTLDPGKLFIVGDPKQSIYRFRRADLDLYGRVKEAIQQQGQVECIHVNFRCAPGIVNEVNQIFEPLMTGPVNGRFEPTHVNLVCYDAASRGKPEVVLLPAPDDLIISELRADDRRGKEFRCIASYIAEVIGSGRKIYDKDSKALRAAELRDVAILYRSGTGLPQLEQALRAYELPYQIAGGKHYYTRLEVQELLAVMLAVDNAYDRGAVLAALRSAFFGFSDEELLEHLLEGGTFNYLSAEQPSKDRLRRAFLMLRELHDLRKEGPAAPVLERLFDLTKGLQIYALKPHGEQRVANLLKVQEMARALEKTERMSFRGFVAWMRSMEAGAQAEAESPIAEPGDSFVRVMTFHTAKGLEFPIVVLADLATMGGRPSQFLIDRNTRRVEMRFGSQKAGLATADWDKASQDDEDRREYEERRLFYVALTRARDLLVLPVGWGKPATGGFVRYLKDRYALTDEGDVRGNDTEAVVHPTGSYDLEREPKETLRFQLDVSGPLPPQAEDAQRQRAEWEATLQARLAALGTPRKVTTATEEAHAGAHEPEELPAGRLQAMAYGTLVHRVFELIDLRNPASVEEIARAEAQRAGLPQADADRAVADVRKVLATPLFAKRIAGAEELYREVPFTISTKEGLLEGTIDLVFTEGQKAIVVDFKTDIVESSGLKVAATRYRKQVSAYARAVQQATQLPVAEALLVFVHLGQEVSIPAEKLGVGTVTSE